jgi:hypothetical protein
VATATLPGGDNMAIRHPEALLALNLIGLDPKKVPTRDIQVAKMHMQKLMRYVGYKCGLEAAKQCDEELLLTQEESQAIGRFLEEKLFFRENDYADKSLFHDMRRLSAILEGSTGYPLTSDENDRLCRLYFIKAVKDYSREKIANHQSLLVDASDSGLKSVRP